MNCARTIPAVTVPSVNLRTRVGSNSLARIFSIRSPTPRSLSIRSATGKSRSVSGGTSSRSQSPSSRPTYPRCARTMCWSVLWIVPYVPAAVHASCSGEIDAQNFSSSVSAQTSCRTDRMTASFMRGRSNGADLPDRRAVAPEVPAVVVGVEGWLDAVGAGGRPCVRAVVAAVVDVRRGDDGPHRFVRSARDHAQRVRVGHDVALHALAIRTGALDELIERGGPVAAHGLAPALHLDRRHLAGETEEVAVLRGDDVMERAVQRPERTWRRPLELLGRQRRTELEQLQIGPGVVAYQTQECFVGHVCSSGLPRLRNLPRPFFPRKRSPSTITSPRLITTSALPFTLRPSYGL